MAETFSYNESYPTDKDKVRGLIPDKPVNGIAYLSDQQINLVLASQSNLRLAVAECCEIIASKLAPDAVSYAITTGAGTQINNQIGPSYFLRRAKQLRDEESRGQPFFSSDNFDYSVDKYGTDGTEYVGD
jgi:hypothetical protein